MSAPASSSTIDRTTTARGGVLAQALLAALLGLALLAGAGFSHVDALHNAAHDARHAAGFPCH